MLFENTERPERVLSLSRPVLSPEALGDVETDENFWLRGVCRALFLQLGALPAEQGGVRPVARALGDCSLRRCSRAHGRSLCFSSRCDSIVHSSSTTVQFHSIQRPG